MKVRYSKWLSVPILVVGVVNLVLGLWLAALTGQLQIQILVGALAALGGVLCLINPAFVLETDNLALYRPIGLVSRRYPFRSRSEVRIEGNRLMVGNDCVPVRKWALNRSDWQALAASITG